MVKYIKEETVIFIITVPLMVANLIAIVSLIEIMEASIIDIEEVVIL